ncbi:MAG: hypothetical protein JVY19_05455 [Ferrovum myxofaciens]|uniref:hypothetical protein n=1 Tax=Ferrovum myxofaciens TaxID=416213 RepID=UPI001C7533F4|nr:hypothetical protein [Ferrovum myxofaciens]QWY75870.1 MAG: hypothetical protein JVY19_05455 [Ferrovum myxofaciens]
MAKDSAQRQAQYRSKRPYAGVDGNGERRINTWVSTGCALALARLARHKGDDPAADHRAIDID